VPPAASIMAIVIIACAVVAFLIHVCLFIRYKARGAANSKGSRVLWIIASVVLGPLVWPVWWLTHRCAAKTPSMVYPEESCSLSDPLISKPSAPFIDDDCDSLYAHADARSGGPAARPFAAEAASVYQPPAPPSARFDAAARTQPACADADGARSSFHPAMTQ
jgi:hypothetical protein